MSLSRRDKVLAGFGATMTILGMALDLSPLNSFLYPWIVAFLVIGLNCLIQLLAEVV